jgi:hypothetical protein
MQQGAKAPAGFFHCRLKKKSFPVKSKSGSAVVFLSMNKNF